MRLRQGAARGIGSLSKRGAREALIKEKKAAEKRCDEAKAQQLQAENDRDAARRKAAEDAKAARDAEALSAALDAEAFDASRRPARSRGAPRPRASIEGRSGVP